MEIIIFAVVAGALGYIGYRFLIMKNQMVAIHWMLLHKHLIKLNQKQLRNPLLLNVGAAEVRLVSVLAYTS